MKKKTKLSQKKTARDFFVGYNGKEFALIADDYKIVKDAECNVAQHELSLYLEGTLVGYFVSIDYFYTEEMDCGPLGGIKVCHPDDLPSDFGMLK